MPFDSIMIDMSHHDKEDNLRLTAGLVKEAHAKGIAVEAEPGRIEGGEDGLVDTVDLEGLLTDEATALEFEKTGIQFLAPAFGNLHGVYGKKGPQLDFDRWVRPFPYNHKQTANQSTGWKEYARLWVGAHELCFMALTTFQTRS